MEEIIVAYKAIGYIRTPFKEKKGIPIQSSLSNAIGSIKLFPQYSEGLSDLTGFSHIILIYHFHKVFGFQLKVTPFLDKEERGIFSTRAPVRPNPIGISIVEYISGNKEENVLKIRGVDMLDHTPLLDIKPFIPMFDNHRAKTGWISKVKLDFSKKKVSDNRF